LKERLERLQRGHLTNNPNINNKLPLSSAAPVESLLSSCTSTIHKQKEKEQQQQKAISMIPSNLSYSDVFVGELLGTGAYASVYNVSFQKNRTKKNKRQKALSCPSKLTFEQIGQPDDGGAEDERCSRDDLELVKHLKNHHDHHDHENLPLSRPFHDNNSNSPYSYYALKNLQQDKLLLGLRAQGRSARAAKFATTDFVRECQILVEIARYKHPNIISLIGVSDNFTYDPSRGFLVLEKVTETLQQALVRWRKRDENTSGITMDCNNDGNHSSILPLHYQGKNNKRFLQRQQAERVRLAGLGVARALKFLHEHRIMHRGM
jgi:hypothetical protein